MGSAKSVAMPRFATRSALAVTGLGALGYLGFNGVPDMGKPPGLLPEHKTLVALNTAPRENTKTQQAAAAEQRSQLAIAEAAEQAKKAAQLAQQQAEAEAEETQRRETEAQRQRCLQQQAQAEEEAKGEAQRKGDAQRAVILRTCVAT